MRDPGALMAGLAVVLFGTALMPARWAASWSAGAGGRFHEGPNPPP